MKGTECEAAVNIARTARRLGGTLQRTHLTVVHNHGVFDPHVPAPSSNTAPSDAFNGYMARWHQSVVEVARPWPVDGRLTEVMVVGDVDGDAGVDNGRVGRTADAGVKTVVVVVADAGVKTVVVSGQHGGRLKR